MKILFIFGTRPEAIKMAPLIKQFQEHSNLFSIKVCVTAQHREMLDQVLNFFQIIPDYDLNVMKANQSLFVITSEILSKLEQVLIDYEPDHIFIQGDTTTVLVAALAAYYHKIKISHLEAGLRSGDKYSPFPEEMNRRLSSHLSDYHFAPTDLAVMNLKKEGIENNVWNVGNTVIDAILLGIKLIKDKGEDSYYSFFRFLDMKEKIVLITGHRRESFGKPFENICNAIQVLAQKYPEVQWVYPVHLNPNVQEPVHRYLDNIKNVFLIEPINYSLFIWLLSRSYFVLTDSGGVQEEAPTLGKPVLVMRDVTERKEGIDAGTAKLVGTNLQTVINEASKLLEDMLYYNQMSNAVNPYGDGKSSERILDIYIKQIIPMNCQKKH